MYSVSIQCVRLPVETSLNVISVSVAFNFGFQGVEEVIPKMKVGDRWVLTIPVSV